MPSDLKRISKPVHSAVLKLLLASGDHLVVLGSVWILTTDHVALSGVAVVPAKGFSPDHGRLAYQSINALFSRWTRFIRVIPALKEHFDLALISIT